MTGRQDSACEEVRLSAMAALDGERAAMPAAVVDAHLSACAGCREAVLAMKATLVELTAEDYAGPSIDLWPPIATRIGGLASARREWMALTILALLSVAWRAGQLVFEWPLPVLNSLIPLAALVLVTRWFLGDPLAIKMTMPELRQERA